MSDLKNLQTLAKDYSILYVEDNDSLRANADRLLHKFFHIVTTAKDGEEALKEFKKNTYPIVLTDIKMPNMDGVTLTKEIKKIAPKTHVVVMSAYDDKEYLLDLIEYGIFKFLKKPVNLENLTDVLYTTVLKMKEENSSAAEEGKKKEVDTKKVVNEDANLDNVSLLFSILSSLKEKNEKIEVHNYYKGLSITNEAKILDVGKNTVLIKTAFTQQKAIQHTSKTTLVSEFLPYVVECSEVRQVSFEKHVVELKHLKFTKTSPIDRKTMRLYPEGEYTISLYLKEKRITQEIKIEDISLSSVRVSLESLPAGLKTCKEIRLEISLEKDLFSIDTKVNIFRIEDNDEDFSIVLLFEKIQKAKFMKYITKRQMAIIREFKGMQNG